MLSQGCRVCQSLEVRRSRSEDRNQRASCVPGKCWSRVFFPEPAENLYYAVPIDIYDDLVVPQALTSFHRTKVPQQAKMTIAHASQSAILEPRQKLHRFDSVLR
jgi:hypothetical protein